MKRKTIFVEKIKNATNVYRTKYFIVAQDLKVQLSEEKDNQMFSYDTYYRRTLARDFEYVNTFIDKDNINGKRLPSTVYTRKYVN